MNLGQVDFERFLDQRSSLEITEIELKRAHTISFYISKFKRANRIIVQYLLQMKMDVNQMLRNLTQIPRSTFRTLVERKRDEERKERAWLDRWARIDRQIRRIGQTGGSAFLFLPFWFTVERTTNKWPATCTRATSTRIGKRMLRSECRFRESFVNRALATRFWGRGDTLIDHHLLSSLYPLFFSRFFSLSLSAPRFRLSILFFPSLSRV